MSEHTVSDKHLMLDVAKGDLEAFEHIVRRHHAWAWRIAYRFLGQKEDAEDIVQKAFLRLLDASGRYQSTSLFRTYFHRIISRLCLDQAKKKHPLYLDTVPDSPEPGPDAQSEMLSRERADAVREALDGLPVAQRLAMVLRYYENLNYHNIASALDTTPKAVERLLARGRERLQSILADKK